VVEAQLSAPALVTNPRATLFYGKDDATLPVQLEMPITDTVATATLPLNQGGAHTLSVVVQGLVADRPVVLYTRRAITPQFTCELQRVGVSDARDLGELTTMDPVDLSLQCQSKDGSNPQIIDIQKVILRDAQNQVVPDMAAKLLNFGVVSEKEGLVQWPITLQNIDLLSGGRYTLEIPVQVYGETIPVQYTFVRPAVAIGLTWDGYSDAQSVLDMGALDAGQNALTACVTATIPALAKAATLASAVTVTALSHVSQKVTTDGVTAQIQPNDPSCPNGRYALRLTVPASLDTATYRADLVLTTSDPKVQVLPQPVHVQFTTAQLQAELVFLHAVAGTKTPTYEIQLPASDMFDFNNVDVIVPYTATLTGTTSMPLLGAPRYKVVETVDGKQGYWGITKPIQAYWEGTVPNQAAPNRYTGAIALTNLPRFYTWDSAAYDVNIEFTDPQIVSPHKIAFRVNSIAYGNQLILMVLVLVMIVVGFFVIRSSTKPKTPPATQ
jgi:hypothetical protein